MDGTIKHKKKRMRKTGILPEDFFRIKEVSQPVISHNGKFGAFVLSEVDGVQNRYNHSIYTVKLDGKFLARKFTAGGSPGDNSPSWSPDGKTLAFVSSRGGKPQIFLIRMDGGEAESFTSMQNGAFSPSWSPDGKFIAFLSATNEEERMKEDEERRKFLDRETGDGQVEKQLKTKFELEIEEKKKKEEERKKTDPRVITRMVFRQGTEFLDDRRNHIYIKRIDSDEPPLRITNGDFDFGQPSWSADSEFILSAVNTTGQEDVSLKVDIVRIPREGGEPEVLVGDGHANFNPVQPVESELIFFATFLDRDLHEQNVTLRVFDPTTGGVRDLTYDLDISFVSFKPTTDGKTVYLNTQSKGRVEVVSLNLENGVLETLLTGDRFIEEFDISDDGKSIFFKVTSPSIPSDIFFTNDYSKEKRITEINKDYLNTRKLSLPEEFLFRANDGTEIQGWLMKPHGFRKDRKYPLVVQIHGGPHIMWGNSFWHEFQSFTGAGYAVFFCNPRGSDGYGRTFRGAIKNRWGEEDMHDILTGVDKLVEQGFIDTNNLFLTGGSFGGFMTAWIVGHDDRFRAAVSQRGVYSLSTLYGCSDAYKLVEWEFDSFPWRDGAFLHERSPVAYIDRINTPLMILHSEQDYRAGIATADELFAGLRRLDKEAVMVRYPREGHELSRSGEPLHRVDRIKRMINWFETHKG